MSEESQAWHSFQFRGSTPTEAPRLATKLMSMLTLTMKDMRTHTSDWRQ